MADADNPATIVEQWIEEKGAGDSSPPPALSVIVPAYNERWRLPPTLIEMFDYLDSTGAAYEIIVVDDGSRDDTSELVRKFEKIKGSVRLIRLPRNSGKGHAVRLGMLNARGELALFADADGSTPFHEIEKLKKAIAEGADVAIGSRALASAESKVVTRFYRKALGRSFNALVNVMLLPGIADTQCGFKLFRARAAKFLFSRQQSDGFAFDIEILFLARRAGLKVKEVPINWHHSPGSKVNLVVDALKMFASIAVFRLRHRHTTPADYAAPSPSA